MSPFPLEIHLWSTSQYRIHFYHHNNTLPFSVISANASAADLCKSTLSEYAKVVRAWRGSPRKKLVRLRSTCFKGINMATWHLHINTYFQETVKVQLLLHARWLATVAHRSHFDDALLHKTGCELDVYTWSGCWLAYFRNNLDNNKRYKHNSYSYFPLTMPCS